MHKQVALVDGDDQRHLRVLNEPNGLDRLRHDRVVGRDDEHHNVGQVRTERAHVPEGRVSGRVHHAHALAARVDHKGADRLRDAADFARRDRRVAAIVEKRGLTVIDVAHHAHDRRARLPRGQVGRHRLPTHVQRAALIAAAAVLISRARHDRLVPELEQHERRRVDVHHVLRVADARLADRAQHGEHRLGCDALAQRRERARVNGLVGERDARHARLGGRLAALLLAARLLRGETPQLLDNVGVVGVVW